MVFILIFHEDAEKAAKVLDLTVTRRGKKVLAGFPHHALDSCLIKAKYKVAVIEQIEK